MVTRYMLTALVMAVPLSACMREHVVTTPGPYIDSHRADQAIITRFEAHAAS